MLFKVMSFSINLLFLIAIVSGNVNADNGEGSLITLTNEESVEAEISEENEIQSDEIFTPTDEWQEIKPGQSIPKGLHIRINLETGLKEAKLMDNPNRENDPEYLRRLKELTKDVSEMKKKFRTKDELKKELNEMHITVKTDYEILTELIKKLKTKLTDDEKIVIYNDIEYYVHQFDNGQDFVTMNGIELILPEFNSTNEELRAMAAFVLGSAMQNNPKVQIAALENGLLPIILRIISHDSSSTVRKRSLYALSCLIRHFPLAQQKFVEHGGLAELTKLFNTKLNQPQHLKLQIKVVSLLSDLLQEQLSTTKYNSESNIEKKRQYDKVQLKPNLVEQGWCYNIPRPLIVNEHDGREKVIEAMILLAENCRNEFQKSNSLLKTIYLEYEKLSSDEDDSDKYFTHLKEMVEVLLRELNDNSIKDEL